MLSSDVMNGFYPKRFSNAARSTAMPVSRETGATCLLHVGEADLHPYKACGSCT